MTLIKSWAWTVPCLLIACMACSPSSEVGNYKIALVPSRTGQHGIFVMNSDTTGGKLLTPDPTAQVRVSSWSPDGKIIAYFADRREDSLILNKYRIPLHSLLYLVN